MMYVIIIYFVNTYLPKDNNLFSHKMVSSKEEYIWKSALLKKERKSIVKKL